MGLGTKTYWLTDRQSQCDFDFDFGRQQAEVIQNHENANVCNIGQGKPRHRKYKSLKFGGGQA
jgi:hypothetical protein